MPACFGLPLLNVHVVERAPEKALADGLETQRHVGDVEVVARLDGAGVGELLFGQQLRDLLGHRFGGVDQRDLVADHLAQQRFQEWVVGAAEDQGVDVLGQERLQIFLCGETGDFVVEPAFFYERYEQCAGLRMDARIGRVFVDGARIGIAVDGGGGADAANFSATARGYGTGVDYVEHRHRRQVLDHLSCHRRHGVAGDDQQLDLLFQQELRDLGGEVGDSLDRLYAVGHARGVAEIDDVLVGQPFHQRAHNRQPADAGIEYADGGICIRGHGWQDDTMRKTAFYLLRHTTLYSSARR